MARRRERVRIYRNAPFPVSYCHTDADRAIRVSQGNQHFWSLVGSAENGNMDAVLPLDAVRKSHAIAPQTLSVRSPVDSHDYTLQLYSPIQWDGTDVNGFIESRRRNSHRQPVAGPQAHFYAYPPVGWRNLAQA